MIPGQPKATADAAAAPPINRPRVEDETCVIGAPRGWRDGGSERAIPALKEQPCGWLGEPRNYSPKRWRRGGRLRGRCLAMKRLFAVAALLLAGCASAPRLVP